MDYIQDERLLINNFIRGLNLNILGPIRMADLEDLRVVMEKTYIAKEVHSRTQESCEWF